MDFNESHEKLIQGGVTAVVGFAAWLTQATSKFASQHAGDPNYGIFSKWRMADALTAIGGTGLSKTIFPNFYPANYNVGPTILPLGFLNKTFFAGIAIAVADALASEVKFYKQMPAISSIMKGAAWGLAIGGAIGGVFDPDPKAASPSGLGSTASIPSGFSTMAGYANAVQAHNLSINQSR